MCVRVSFSFRSLRFLFGVVFSLRMLARRCARVMRHIFLGIGISWANEFENLTEIRIEQEKKLPKNTMSLELDASVSLNNNRMKIASKLFDRLSVAIKTNENVQSDIKRHSDWSEPFATNRLFMS